MKHIRKQKAVMGVPLAVCLGMASSTVLSLIVVGIITVAVSNERMLINTAIAMIPVVQFLSSFIGCFITGLTAVEKKVMASGIVCGVYYLLLVVVSALFLEGVSGKFWLGIIATVIGCLAAIFLFTREKSTGRGYKHKKVFS